MRFFQKSAPETAILRRYDTMPSSWMLYASGMGEPIPAATRDALQLTVSVFPVPISPEVSREKTALMMR